MTTLFYVDGYSQKDTAEFLELPLTTAKKRLHDSRKRLKERMIRMVSDELRRHFLDDRFVARVMARYRLGCIEETGRDRDPEHEGRMRRFKTANGSYVLKLHHEYTTQEVMTAVEAVRGHLRRNGFSTPGAVRTQRGEHFVDDDGRLAAVFEWAEGRHSHHNSTVDLCEVAEVQGRWIEAMQSFDDSVAISVLRQIRRRKTWAWIVPLDDLAGAVKKLNPVEKVRSFKTSASYHLTYLDGMAQVESRWREYCNMVKEHDVQDLPHCVTHGDLWAGNVLLGKKSATVVDLDLCSYEPRMADFARMAAWRYDLLQTEGISKAFSRFQSRTFVDREEIASIPVLMVSHHMYYLLMHCLLYTDEPEGCAGYLVEKTLPSELRAFDTVVSHFSDIERALCRA